MTPDSAAPTIAPENAAGPLPPPIGRYQIVERIGAGGMGTVYKARDPHLKRTVALKVPKIDAPASDRALRMERFQREARAAAQVWHPHVCPIYDVGEHEGQPFVVMAFVEGQSLAECLAQQGPFKDVAEAVALILQVLDALGAVHGHGIVHRDLKPSNIMLDAGGRAVLTDFGLARPEKEAERLTSEGVIVGTPAYMAPEQAAGQSERIGPWTDLYSVGVVFFEMLTGRLPFQGTQLAVLAQILHEPAPPVSRLRPYLDPRLDSILLKALNKEPDGRFQRAREFRDALAALAVPTTTLPQPWASREEVHQRRTFANPPGSNDYLKWLQWGALLVLPAASFALAGVCLLVHVMGRNKEALVVMAYLVVVGTIPIVFGVMSQRGWRRALTKTNPNGETILMKAAEQGHVSQVKNFLARGAESNDKDRNGQTALMKAVENGHAAVVKLLLAGGAEINERDHQGQTALTKAKARKHLDIVDLLETAGAKG